MGVSAYKPAWKQQANPNGRKAGQGDLATGYATLGTRQEWWWGGGVVEQAAGNAADETLGSDCCHSQRRLSHHLAHCRLPPLVLPCLERAGLPCVPGSLRRRAHRLPHQCRPDRLTHYSSLPPQLPPLQTPPHPRPNTETGGATPRDPHRTTTAGWRTFPRMASSTHKPSVREWVGCRCRLCRRWHQIGLGYDAAPQASLPYGRRRCGSAFTTHQRAGAVSHPRRAT